MHYIFDCATIVADSAIDGYEICLPHTYIFATLSLKNGVDVKTLSGALGHYSAGFTLNTYTHATAQMKQDAADTIGAVISQAM